MTTHSLDAFRLKDGMEFLHHAPLALHCQHFRAPGLFFISVVITCRLKDIITLFFYWFRRDLDAMLDKGTPPAGGVFMSSLFGFFLMTGGNWAGWDRRRQQLGQES